MIYGLSTLYQKPYIYLNELMTGHGFRIWLLELVSLMILGQWKLQVYNPFGKPGSYEPSLMLVG